MTGGGACDRLLEFDHGRVAFIGGCALIEAAMGPVFVVMGHELFEESAEVGVGPGRGAGLSAGPFPWPALRTGRATFTASGSPPGSSQTVLEQPVPQYPPRADARGGSSVFTVGFCHTGPLLLPGCPPSPCDRLSRPRTTTRTPPRHGAIS